MKSSWGRRIVMGAALALGAAAAPAQDDGARGSAGETRAFDSLLERANRGDPIAQNNLGVFYLKGRGTVRDYREALRWFDAAAAAGLPSAMHNLGVMHLRGHGLAPDSAAAADWFLKAAELGDMDAQFYLARLLYQGDGIPTDLPAAREWFGRAADQGLPPARFNLALMLLRGQGGVPDEGRALHYLEALEGNNEEARLLIAQIHLLHAEEPARAQQALARLRPMAEAGSPDAQFHLGMALMLGQGVARDREEGRFWLLQAGSAGLVVAQHNLAGLYERGLGVEVNPVEAAAWYSLAATNGDAQASALLEQLRGGLSAQEQARAEARVAEMQANHPEIIGSKPAAGNVP